MGSMGPGGTMVEVRRAKDAERKRRARAWQAEHRNAVDAERKRKARAKQKEEGKAKEISQAQRFAD